MAIRIVIVASADSGADEAIAAAVERQLHVHAPVAFPPGSDALARLEGLRVVCSSRVTLRPSDWLIETATMTESWYRHRPVMADCGGFHTVVPSRDGPVPYAVVNPANGRRSTTISHEALEMLGSPFLAHHVTRPNGVPWAFEPADPTARDEYELDGVMVSNFCTARWWGLPSDDRRYDYMGLISEPFRFRPGGYLKTLAHRMTGPDGTSCDFGEQYYRDNGRGGMVRLAS